MSISVEILPPETIQIGAEVEIVSRVIEVVLPTSGKVEMRYNAESGYLEQRMIGTATWEQVVNLAQLAGGGIVIDNLLSESTTAALSARQGKILKGIADDLQAILNSDEPLLDTLQEVVAFITVNREILDALSIENIAGLAAALEAKETPAGAQAKADAAAAFARQRANHQGTQAIDTIFGLGAALATIPTSTDGLTEGSKLFFTDSRARSALLAGLLTNGFVANVGGALVRRDITTPMGGGIVLSGGSGATGNPSIALVGILSALAAIHPGVAKANRLPYIFSVVDAGEGNFIPTWAEIQLTAASMAILAAADYAAMKTLMGAASNTQVIEFLYNSVTGTTAATGANGVWNLPLPTGWKSMDIECINGGGGGGSGRRGAIGSISMGGGGGQGSGVGISRYTNDGTMTSIDVFVGAGGAGGAAVTTDDTNGNSGGAGGASYVFSGALLLGLASGNLGGAPTGCAGGGGGTLTTGSGGNNVVYTPFAGSGGGGASSTATPGSVSYATNTTLGRYGGNAGGSFDAANNFRAGGSSTFGNGGGNPNSTGAAFAGGSVTNIIFGKSPHGWGGGGGGASRNGFNSGAGGNGAPGIVKVTFNF